MFKAYDYYKANFTEVIERFEKFYGAVSSGKTGNFIYRALLASDEMLFKNLKLNSYDFENGIDRYIDDLVRETEKTYDARRQILDDTLPSISPILGIGDYSAIIAGDIIFGEDTSWSQPMLEKLEDWKRLEEIGSVQWYGKFMLICEKLMMQVSKAGIPFMRGFFSPLDLAHALRGAEIYTDFYDNPEGVHELLDFCTNAIIKHADDLKSKVYKHLGGTRYGAWHFKDSINMSEDISCMISPELYREFEAPHTQKIIEHFGNGYMHCHSRALYLVPEICRLKNVKNIWIASDPNEPQPIDVLKSLIGKADNVCLSIDCNTFEEIEKNIDIAKEGNIAFCTRVASADEANRNTEFIRKHSNC